MVELSSTTLAIVSVVVLLLILVLWFMSKKINKLNNDISRLNNEITAHEQQLKEVEKATRKDSTNRQRAILKGQISETLAPWSLDAVNSVKELSFLGNPIDFIGFKGLDGDGPIEIKFIEIKTGKSALTQSEKRVKKAVDAKRVEWKTIEVKDFPETVEK